MRKTNPFSPPLFSPSRRIGFRSEKRNGRGAGHPSRGAKDIRTEPHGATHAAATGSRAPAGQGEVAGRTAVA
eukprot:2431024-Amphidinium_carterae.2